MRRSPFRRPWVRSRTRRLLRRLSLRTRLLFLSMALVAVGLLATGVVVSTALQDYLQDRVDERLTVIGQFTARAAPAPGGEAPRKVRAVSLGDNTVAFVDDEGALRGSVDATTPPPGGGPDLPALDLRAVAAKKGRPFTVPSHDGSHDWRVVALPRTNRQPSPQSNANADNRGGDDDNGSVVVASSLQDVDNTVGKTRTLSLTAGSVLLGALGVAGWFAVRSGLHPLTSIEETSAAITTGDFSQRIPELAGPNTEVGRLTQRLNTMLTQIDTAFQARAEAESRMRHFFADASHELRTPLVGIKGYTDLYQMGFLPSRQDIDITMSRIAKESARLTQLVENMLLLARLDEEARTPSSPGPAHELALPLDLEPMDLRTLAADALHDVRALDATRPVSLTGPGGGKPATAPALADEARLRQVVSNLVGNAVTHTPPGTPVRIGVGTAGEHTVLEVEDHGPGLRPRDQHRVFDRFYRTDGSRTRAGNGGSGLGLAIAQSLVSAHNGRITLDTAPGAGCTFRVLLPLPDEAPDVPSIGNAST
ncbi:HAMP domain-containing sensor histidine kinase [Streptomyces smyrnaeus]|uniref:HAMP domain-containing sensor histidine kinase n=1 Tax=Streptomyces smyrnaeus TaxID=1387713 RepID=UPI0033F50E59